MVRKVGITALIDQALKLGGDPEKIRQFYGQWAESYDEDLAHDRYVAPATVVEQLVRHFGKADSTPRRELSVIDAGCGTGLVGGLLKAHGFGRIAGFDLSHDMINVAKRSGAYTTLFGGVDLNRPITALDADLYDAAVSCGVFTSGHVAPRSIANLAALVRSGGALVVSTRTAYCDESDFESVSASLEREGVFECLEVLRDRPYIVDGAAHYWLYRIS